MTGIVLAGTAVKNAARGSSWRRALPPGYYLSLLGVGMFIMGGGFDLFWHSLFGFEVNIEALLSPAHLLLATGGTLILTGPLRSVWRRYPAGQAHGWPALGPAIISLTLVLSLLTLFTQYAHPFVVGAGGMLNTRGAGQLPAGDEVIPVVTGMDLNDLRFTIRAADQHDQIQAHPGGGSTEASERSTGLGLSSILLQTALLMGTVLILVQRWQLPLGALLMLLTVNGLVMIVQSDHFRLLPAVLITGIAAELMASHLQPTGDGRNRLYLFAFGLPVVLWACYFLIMSRAGGIEWSTHLWTGSIFTAGIIGLLIGFLLESPLRGPEAVEPVRERP